MTDFSTTASLFVELDQQSVKQARSDLQTTLSADPVTVGANVDRPGSMLSGGRAGGVTTGVTEGLSESFTESTSLLQETAELDAERNTLLHDIRDYAERGAMSGGGGGGGMMSSLLPIGVFSALKGGLGTLLGKTSLGSLVTSVSLKSLITRVPAFATLVTAADLSKDLVTGTLTKDDLVSAPIELGNMLTFGMLDSSVIEGAIGTVTLGIGTYQIGSIIAGKLGGSALASYFGTMGVSSLLSGTVGGSALGSYFGTTSLSGMLAGVGGGSSLGGLLGTVGMGTLLTGLSAGALAGLLGTISITEILSGGKVNFNWGGTDPENTTNVDRGASGTATGWNPRGPTDIMEAYNANTSTSSELTAREKFQNMTQTERQEAALENQSFSMTVTPENNSDSLSTSERQQGKQQALQRLRGHGGGESGHKASGRSKTSSGSSRRKNTAREKSRQQPKINYSPTYDVDLKKLERKIDKDLRELSRKVSTLEKQLDSISTR